MKAVSDIVVLSGYRERPLTWDSAGRTTLGALSGDVWPGAADDDGLRGSKESDDNVED